MARYFVVSEGFFLASLPKALDGAGIEGGAFRVDRKGVRPYTSRQKAARVAAQIHRGAVYRLDSRDVLSVEGLKIGDTLDNRYVGECRVEGFGDPLGKNWLRVSYEGVHLASGETRRYERMDPAGVGDDGIAYFKRLD